MVIDFHTHVFPDALAGKAIKLLADEIDNAYIPVSDGTIRGLIKNMDDWGIDISVNNPVITKGSQFKSTNEWAASVCSDRVISFGGFFPHTDDYKRDIDFIADLGLKGIKFHAEYQDFILDEPKMLKIYDYALGKGLILLHHAGSDPAFKPPFRSSPKQFARVYELMGGGIIVAAHFGGCDQWDEVFSDLAGSGVYIDTSMGFEYFTREQFLRIVKKHGADKVLFASDAPWSNAKTEMEHLLSMPLEKSEIDAILGGNAEKLLGI